MIALITFFSTLYNFDRGSMADALNYYKLCHNHMTEYNLFEEKKTLLHYHILSVHLYVLWFLACIIHVAV